MSIRTMVRKIRVLTLWAAVAMAATVAQAAECFYSEGIRIGEFSFDFGQVVVDNNQPVGAVLAHRQGALRNAWIANCNFGETLTVQLRGTQGALVSNTSMWERIYSTNVPGVGYRIQVFGGRESATGALPFEFSVEGTTPSSTTSNYRGWVQFNFDLIKTAKRVGNGLLTPGLYGHAIVANKPRDYYFRVSLSGGKIVAPSCTLSELSRNPTVRMGRVPIRDFAAGIGTVARDTPFNIEVACQAAPGTVQSTVSMTMDPTRATTLPGVLAINEGGPGQITASGVGIQVLDAQRRPVEFGKAATVGQSRDSTYVVPFVARYMRTGSELKPGIANATATITLTHQ
ncbi:fimbrial protein [Variovorax sp. DAIF25]|uniref:fimbrial protein n=1 Tax=Variovorax sp. DAIF25 TaxID=3080983 RepID=UPI003D6B9D7C